jgi:hypothetical protein
VTFPELEPSGVRKGGILGWCCEKVVGVRVGKSRLFVFSAHTYELVLYL